MRVNVLSPLPLLLLAIPLFVLRRRGKSAGYLVGFSLFFLYAWAVLVYTILDHLPIDQAGLEMVRSSRWSACIHLVPSLLTGDFDPRSEQVYGNFLLGIPFGLGVPFVARTTHRAAVLLGLGLGVGLELAQLFIGLAILRGPYRVIDIDDVWLVFAGALFGHAVLFAAARVYRRVAWSSAARTPVWDHFHAVLLGVASARGSAHHGPQEGLETG